MIRLFYILAFLTACAGNIQAQNASEEPISKPRPPIRYEIGLNTAPLINRVLRSNTDSLSTNPYLLTAKIIRGPLALRTGFGGRYTNKRRFEAGFADSETRLTKGWDARAGLEWHTRVSKNERAQLILGLDGVGTYQITQESIDSGFDVITRTQQFSAWGGGASVGFNFWLTQHFSLMLESNFYWYSGTFETARQFKNFPELDDFILKESTRELRTMLPTSLFLVYRFN